MTKKIVLDRTIAEVARCFELAEQRVRSGIKDLLGTLSEPDITFQFRALLSEELDTSSKQNRIANAFANDLETFLNHEGLSILYMDNPLSLAQGLVATAAWHPMQTEGKVTGGDFGLVVTQPEVRVAAHYIQLESRKDRSGLLTQAKLKHFQKNWGELKETQMKLLPGREDYLSLLGYEYSDSGNRHLEPFSWSLCRGYKITDVQKWLADNSFPGRTTSSEIIKALAKGRAGTKDKVVIDNIICPEAAPHLTILIDWKGGKPPKDQVNTWHKQEVIEREKVYVRQTGG